MAQDDTNPTALPDQYAQLLARFLALEQQKHASDARALALEQKLTRLEAENTTHASDLHQQSQGTSVSRSPSLRYTPVEETVPSQKRPRSPTLEYVDPPPPTKKGKERARTSESIDQPIASSSRQAPDVPAMGAASDPSSPYDSDLEDPNVSMDEAGNEAEEREAGGSAPPSGGSSLRQRVSARFSSRSSFTTMSTLTPVPSTPGLEDRKPKREPKQEDVPPEIPNDLSDLLASLRPLTIQPPPLTLEIERKFLRLAYGGSDQQLVQIIPAARNPGVGIRRLIFPNLNLNPLMPTSPGAPGLLFTSRHDVLDNPPWALFCKRNSGNAVWLYLGEYECELIGQFTLEQFAVQSSEVKDSWVRLILTKKRQVCYASMRARIALRAAGLIPLEDDEREQELIDEEVKKVQSGKGRDITADQIMQALTNGDEAVDIIRMKCVRYDRDFADDIKRRYADYPEMLKAEEAAKEKKKASGTKSTSKSRRKGKKRKSNTTGGSDREDPESEGEEEGDDYDPAAARTTQGKRKKSPTKASSSKSTRTISGSAASASPCPQRASRPPVIDAADSVDDADDIYATDPEEAAGDAVPEDHGVWKPSSHSMRSSPPSTSGRPPSQRTRKPSLKISDWAKATEH